MLTLPRTALALVALALAACTPDRVCSPGAATACVGPGGCAGGQVCNADGSGFGACDCGDPELDAGPGRDASLDAAPADGSVDDAGTTADGGTDGGELDGAGTDLDAGLETDAAIVCNADWLCSADGNECNGREICTGLADAGLDGDAGIGVCGSVDPLPDGARCTVSGPLGSFGYCMDQACVPSSSCGDGVVQPALGEECDDANRVFGDGCDACAFACHADADCDDADPCNGAEICDATHRCAAGTSLAPGASCAGGAGVCLADACRPRACTRDSDCADVRTCNGAERCGVSGCEPGPPPCEGVSAPECAQAACVEGFSTCSVVPRDDDHDGVTGARPHECLPAADTDCDDSDPSAFPGAQEVCDGADDDCDGAVDEASTATWYADCDGDGFAAAAAESVDSCAPPTGPPATCAAGSWTALIPVPGRVDCADLDPRANPRATEYHTTPILGGVAPYQYDFDCNARVDFEGTAAARACERVDSDGAVFCVPPRVGFGPRGGACGATDEWLVACRLTELGCESVYAYRTRACR